MMDYAQVNFRFSNSLLISLFLQGYVFQSNYKPVKWEVFYECVSTRTNS